MNICTYSYEEYLHLVKSFHGSLAPGLLIGGFIVDLALKHLPEGEFFDALCETPVCLPDAVQILTPCTIGNGWLTVLSIGRFAVTMYEKESGRGVRVYLDMKKLENWPEVRDWYLKRKKKQEQDLDLLLAIPGHRVTLPGGYYPAENDVWALLRTKHGLVSLVVKGLAREPFGEMLGEWRDEGSPGKQRRLEFLCAVLDLDHDLPEVIRYPLLKWTASAVMEAVRFHATHAVLLVHSFTPVPHWFDDFERFCALFGARAAAGECRPAGERMGVELHLGWVRGDERYLAQ